jgi:hypothetical protein
MKVENQWSRKDEEDEGLGKIIRILILSTFLLQFQAYIKTCKPFIMEEELIRLIFWK